MSIITNLLATNNAQTCVLTYLLTYLLIYTQCSPITWRTYLHTHAHTGGWMGKLIITVRSESVGHTKKKAKGTNEIWNDGRAR